MSSLMLREDEQPSRGWMIAGLFALGFGAWCWYHFGGDVKRYIKMERM